MSNVSAAIPFTYIGGELDLFEKAVSWKRYWRGRMQHYIGGDVLEVGAGTGSNTRLLSGIPHRSWTCLEPDQILADKIVLARPNQRIQVGTLADVTSHFDTILYIDVLEHVEQDRVELTQAGAHLNPGGHLIVLSPAHSFLFTPFDSAIGHFRRYSRSSLLGSAGEASTKTPLLLVRMEYLDSVGMLASLGNRLLLNQSMPTERQILLWDRWMVPLSRFMDPLTGRRAGKTILGVWRRT